MEELGKGPGVEGSLACLHNGKQPCVAGRDGAKGKGEEINPERGCAARSQETLKAAMKTLDCTKTGGMGGSTKDGHRLVYVTSHPWRTDCPEEEQADSGNTVAIEQGDESRGPGQAGHQGGGEKKHLAVPCKDTEPHASHPNTHPLGFLSPSSKVSLLSPAVMSNVVSLSKGSHPTKKKWHMCDVNKLKAKVLIPVIQSSGTLFFQILIVTCCNKYRLRCDPVHKYTDVFRLIKQSNDRTS